HVHCTSDFGDCTADAMVLRRLADGQPDPSFGSGGQVVLPRHGTDDAAVDAAVQPDGKLVVASVGGGAATVSRLLANGDPDTSFGAGDGRVDITGDGAPLPVRVLLEPDGGILLAGSLGGRFAFRHLTASGGASDS